MLVRLTIKTIALVLTVCLCHWNVKRYSMYLVPYPYMNQCLAQNSSRGSNIRIMKLITKGYVICNICKFETWNVCLIYTRRIFRGIINELVFLSQNIIWKYTTKLLCVFYTLIKPTLWYVCWCIRFLSSAGNNFIALHSSPFPFLLLIYFLRMKIFRKPSPNSFLLLFRYNTQLNTIDHGIIKHFHGKLIQKIIPNKLNNKLFYPIGYTKFRLFFIFFVGSQIWLA